MTTFSKLVLAMCSVSLAGVVAAQPKAEPGPLEAPLPKPPAEIASLVKTLQGTWRCTGTAPGADGQLGPMKATVKTKADLDGWWIQDAFDATMGKLKLKFAAYTTYDAASKKWRRVMVDSWGGQMLGSSDGLKDNKLDFNLDSMTPMGNGQFRDHLDVSDPKNLKLWGEASIDKGKTWMKVYEMTCKK